MFSYEKNKLNKVLLNYKMYIHVNFQIIKKINK